MRQSTIIKFIHFVHSICVLARVHSSISYGVAVIKPLLLHSGPFHAKSDKDVFFYFCLFYFTDIDLSKGSDENFVQEYIANPFLVDERKFDIGVYTVLTSIDPLRVYVYDQEVLIR